MVGTRTISIVTPTHNRRVSLQRLLDAIAGQTYPLSSIEVIVVLDACTDDTRTFLQDYRADFSIHFAEQPGLGAANARNAGAALATGDQLIFLDDDIEPSPGLVAAHVEACMEEASVVVGYLPMELNRGAGFFHTMLTWWWEDKYYRMGQPGYRHRFEDLLSGNFSLMASLFKTTGGFNSAFRCREDYELGYRLVKAGARISFCRAAWGYHRDEVTDQVRSHKRKRMEGYWDVAFAKLHPEAIQVLRLSDMRHPSFGKKLKMFMSFHLPLISDVMAFLGRVAMVFFERLNMRKWWRKADEKLQAYWYMRGVGDHVRNRKALNEIFLREMIGVGGDICEVDLSAGVDAAADKIDVLKPKDIRLHFNGKLVGKVETRPGEERFRGDHLLHVLNGCFAEEMMEALVLKDICHPKTGKE